MNWFRKSHSKPKTSREAIRQAVVEALDGRQLFAAAPQLVAIIDGTQTATFGNTQRAIAYYDVSGIDAAGSTGMVFNDDPLFSVWVGYENTLTSNYEDPQALAVNPSNGDTYMLAFDSGVTNGVVGGDTEGDYDLYRIDVASIYADFIANDRPRGIMYHPAVTADGFDGIDEYGSAMPAVESGIGEEPNILGVHTERSNIDSDTTNDFIFFDAIEKVGEIARAGFTASSSPFFDQQDLQFVDSETLLLMENRTVTTGTTPTPVRDYSFRTIERVSTDSGDAVRTGTNDFGGFNAGTTESWESFAWGGNDEVLMDSGGTDFSEVDGMRYVERDGVRGAWVSERDGGGDDFAFFSLDFDARTVDAVGGNFALDEDATANDNEGDVDFFDVDQNGSLVIGESNFTSTPAAESSFQRLTIDDYAGNVDFGTTTQSPSIVPTIDDDAGSTDTRYSVYNRGQNRVYIFDIDSGASPGIIADVYVYDLTTNALVYQELNATNHFFRDANSMRFFTLGDFATVDGSQTSQDGKVDQSDIDALFARIADPTAGGRFSASIGQEMFDLDGDSALSIGDPFSAFTIAGDGDYLVRRVLGTEYGDADLNDVLNADDSFAVDLGSSTGLGGWTFGDFNGDGVVNADDSFVLDLQSNVNPTPTRI